MISDTALKKMNRMELHEIKRLNLPEFAKRNLDIKVCLNNKFHCPFHPPDKNPSCSFWQKNSGEWRFTDHHDDFKGSIIDLATRRKNISTGEAIQWIREIEGKHTNKSNNKKPEIETTYDYKKNRILIFQKVRYKPKGFACRRPGKNGDWIYDLKGIDPILYNYDEVARCGSVWIVEGEKDVETLRELGFVATTAPFGVGDWRPEFTQYFEQKSEVFICLDKGCEDIARKRAVEISRIAKEVRLVELSGLVKGEDITDWFEKMGDIPTEEKKKQLFEVISKTEIFKIINNESPALEKGARPILISLDFIEPKPVEWLWLNRIPLGKLTLIVGDPGIGKSFLTIFLASYVTTGKGWPDIEAPTLKGSVIILTAEDGLADTVRIRADAAGADVKKIKILEGVITKEGEQEFFNLTDHLPVLEKSIKMIEDIRLIIIDPIISYLGKVDSHKNSEVRGVLAPLASLAEKYKIAVVGVTHLNKNEALRAIYRTMGSLAFTAAARSVWAVSIDENDTSRTRRLFMPLKTNLSINPTSLAFTIIDNKVVFEGHPIDINPEEALSKEKSEETSALSQAVNWLKEALEDGPIASVDIYSMAKENHISDITLRRAKDKLGVKSYKEGIAQEGQWFWKLPNE